MLRTPIDVKTAPGHQVLAAAGKQVLRPGGLAATEQLFRWADFQPHQTVLELATSFGLNAIHLAKTYGVRVVGLDNNPESVARARSNVAAAGLGDRIQIVEGDIFHLERIDEQFDFVLAEAILTMQSAPGKAKVLAGVCDRLKRGGQFLSQEMLVNGPDPDAIHQDLSNAIRVNATPLSIQEWVAACQTAGLTVERYDTGAMQLLNPERIAREEGLATLLTIGWNLLTRPALRQRIVSIRETLQHHNHELGYVVLLAQKED